MQAGSYVFMDADYGRNLDDAGRPVSTFRHSLFVLASVMSASKPGVAVLDAGLKSLAVDSGMPTVWQRPDIQYVGASDEHGKLAVGSETAAPSSGRSCGWCRGIATRRSTSSTGMSGCGADGWSVCGRWPRGAG